MANTKKGAERAASKKVVKQKVAGIPQTTATWEEILNGKAKSGKEKAAPIIRRPDGNYFVFINTAANTVAATDAPKSGSCTVYHVDMARVARERRDALAGNKGTNKVSKMVIKPIITSDNKFVIADVTDFVSYNEKGTFMSSSGAKVTADKNDKGNETRPKFTFASYVGPLFKHLMIENRDTVMAITPILGSGAGVRILLSDTKVGTLTETIDSKPVVLFNGEEVTYWEVTGLEIEPKPEPKKSKKASKVVNEDVDVTESFDDDDEINEDEYYDEDADDADDQDYDDEE